MDRGIWLVICGAASEPQAFRIDEGCYVIGRSSDCDIRLLHPTVSRRHAKIKNKGDKLSIEDLGSLNGTFVDGKQIELAEIKVGSSLGIGRVTLDVLHKLASSDSRKVEKDATDLAPVDDSTDLHLRLSHFPPKRMQVLRLLLDGHTEKRIAAKCHVTRNAIDWHVKEIYKDLGVHSRAELSASFREISTIPGGHEIKAGTV